MESVKDGVGWGEGVGWLGKVLLAHPPSHETVLAFCRRLQPRNLKINLNYRGFSARGALAGTSV